MKVFSQADVSESNQSLWLITISPLIWMGHFLLCYLTAAIWCAKSPDPAASLMPVRVTIAVGSALALTGIVLVGIAGYRRQCQGQADRPYDDDTPADRHRFLGFATLLLSGLSAVAVIFVGLNGLFFHDCH